MREGRALRKRDKKKPQSLVYQDFGVVAEKEGFEPSKRFCRLHDFQSCALDQLGDFSISNIQFSLSSERYYYNKHFKKVNP